MRRRSIAAWLVGLAALGGGQIALGEAGGRGIGADVRAARELDAMNVQEAAAQLQRDRDALARQRTHTQLALRARIRALYRITRAGMTPVAGGFEAVRRHVARVKRMSMLVKHDADTLRSLAAREQVLQDRAGTVALAASDARAESSLSAATAPAVARTRPSVGDASAAEDGALAAGSEPMPGAASDSGFYGIRFADGARESAFAAKRGRLATPVAGEVRVVDARRRESAGNGLEFQATAGTPVRAAAAGRIAFCDRYGSYGQLVIIDHGAGYYTAYGGLGPVEVQVGDDVSAFARIGTIAEDANPALYFEVRKGERTLPPRVWLGG